MRIQSSFPLVRALSALALCAGPVHALYTKDKIVAYRVADNAFTIDGKPDSLWRTILADGGSRSLSFQDYSKLVILQPDIARNDDPANYEPDPPPGSATLMAAYDSQALYFYFLVKTKAIADPKALGCTTENLWKIDAAEVYVDPSQWSADPLDYHSYFTADAGGLIYGTSPRTIQVDKPLSSKETGLFYRDRKTADRFQIPAASPYGLNAATARSATDTAWVGVEMRIPFWSSASNFAPGANMFISWGFNLYSDSLRKDCAANPLAYRWAKNFLNYDLEQEKPPGWRQNDSTHYDPSRSWDGWGQLSLLPSLTQNKCHSSDPKATFDANWDPAYWKSSCYIPIATSARGKPGLDAAGMPVPSRLPARDARGRRGPSGSPGFAAPD